MVPTVDTVRYQYLTQTLIKNLCPVMLVGPVGTGKTSVAENTLAKLDPKTYSVLTVNMSAQVSYKTVLSPHKKGLTIRVLRFFSIYTPTLKVGGGGAFRIALSHLHKHFEYRS